MSNWRRKLWSILPRQWLLQEIKPAKVYLKQLTMILTTDLWCCFFKNCRICLNMFGYRKIQNETYKVKGRYLNFIVLKSSKHFGTQKYRIFPCSQMKRISSIGVFLLICTNGEIRWGHSERLWKVLDGIIDEGVPSICCENLLKNVAWFQNVWKILIYRTFGAVWNTWEGLWLESCCSLLP